MAPSNLPGQSQTEIISDYLERITDVYNQFEDRLSELRREKNKLLVEIQARIDAEKAKAILEEIK